MRLKLFGAVKITYNTVNSIWFSVNYRIRYSPSLSRWLIGGFGNKKKKKKTQITNFSTVSNSWNWNLNNLNINSVSGSEFNNKRVKFDFSHLDSLV